METRDPETIENILEVKDLRVCFDTEDGVVQAVDGVSLHVAAGEILGLVGESGCGKSVTARAIMRLVDPPGQIAGGNICFEGRDLMTLPEAEMVKIRGQAISMIFQQPQSALNPVVKVGKHISETLDLHGDLPREQNWQRTIELIRMVEIPDAERRAENYAHEYSGGMAQRAMIAIALACNPNLLIADEPTTALDVTIQAQILALVNQLRQKTNTSVILITHDLGIISSLADRVAVMYAGQIVEESRVENLFNSPLHPYTRGLIRSRPMLGREQDKLDVIPGFVPNLIGLPPGCHFAPRCLARKEYGLAICNQSTPQLEPVNEGHLVRCWLYQDAEPHRGPLASHRGTGRIQLAVTPAAGEAGPAEPEAVQAAGATTSEAACHPYPYSRPLVRVEGLTKHFPVRSGRFGGIRGIVHAVDDVSFSISEGETLGMVGESGCGKTTIGRTILRQIPATAGAVYFRDQNLFTASRGDLKHLRKHMQYIFQNPYASLNPRMRVQDIIAEGLVIQGMQDADERKAIVLDVARKVGLEERCMDHYPHQFSGGQRQRIGIARALALKPEFLILDEPVSALDVSVQSQVLNLLSDLQKEYHLTYLFISHDLSVVEHLSNRVAVMYLGRMVELADRRELYHNPLHPYTVALLSAIPSLGSNTFKEAPIRGDIPSPTNPPPGCPVKPALPQGGAVLF